METRHLLVLILLVAATAAAPAQPVQGDVAAVGFPTGGGTVLREGQWIPLQVRLSVQGDLAFAGQLRVLSVDLDGDRVAFTRDVTVGAEVGAKRFWCYALANHRDELPLRIDVLNTDGARVAQLPMPVQSSFAILNDDLLVLDISTQRVPGLKRLETSPWTPGERGDGLRDFYHNVVVSALPAADLPDRWWGLEAVDVIVWDRPDRCEISRQQLDALVRWVRNGGQLVVGVGAGWDAIRAKPALAEIMPLQGPGATVELRHLPAFLDHVALREDVRQYEQPISVTTAQPAPDAWRTISDRDPSGSVRSLSLITMRLVGSGRVTAAAASLRDLAGVPLDHRKFFGELMDLNPHSKQFKDNQLNNAQGIMWNPAVPLYDQVVPEVGFTKQVALASLLVFLFVAGYILLATLASWWWLLRHGRTHLSWTVFAAFAVVASGLSLGTVAGIRGWFNRGVQTLSVLDLDTDPQTGTTAARGYCLFGYASPIRQRVRLSLPGDDDFLRPLARRGTQTSSFYVTPARYTALPTRGLLDDVLMRATLKQVEGFWQGEVSGAIRANLTVNRASGELTPGSWIANELDVDLAGGYLLFIDPRQVNLPPDAGWQAEAVPYRAAGLTTLYDRHPDVQEVPPAYNVLVVAFGEIPAGKRASGLGAQQYQKVAQFQRAWRRRAGRKRADLLFREDRDLRTLWHQQHAWAPGGFVPGRGALEALLLASTQSFYLHDGSGDGFDDVGTSITTEGLPDLDVSHWLLRGQAVLLCWADDPGPARLHRDGEPLRSYTGLTVYRLRLPIGYTGMPRGPVAGL